MKLWMIEREKFEQGKEAGRREVIEEGMKEGIEKGMKEGIQRMNALVAKLTAANRIDDLLRSTKDREFQEQLFDEFGL